MVTDLIIAVAMFFGGFLALLGFVFLMVVWSANGSGDY